MKRRLWLPLAVLALAILAGAAATATIVLNRRTPGASASLIGGPFSLLDQNGKTITDADLKGEPSLIFFGYTHCPDVCPTTLFSMAQVLKAMGHDPKVRAVFMTVDPERDTPSVMKDYLSSFDAPITGLTGAPDAVRAAMRAYRVYAKKVPGKNGEYTMDHSAVIYLMDKDGGFVSAFNLEQPPAAAAKELSNYL